MSGRQNSRCVFGRVISALLQFNRLVEFTGAATPTYAISMHAARWSTVRLSSLYVAVAMVAALLSFGANAQSRYFVVRVVDEQTDRGVPLVELKLPNEVKYWTDSAGVAALDEPSLRGREAFLGVRSHGYEVPQETFFGRGVNVAIEPGKMREVRIRRTMIAERLYRLTGEGIYRDSVMAGLPVSAKDPLLNAQVLGQDTVSAAVYRGRIFWIWGDTIGPAYANFSVSARRLQRRERKDTALQLQPGDVPFAPR